MFPFSTSTLSRVPFAIQLQSFFLNLSKGEVLILPTNCITLWLSSWWFQLVWTTLQFWILPKHCIIMKLNKGFLVKLWWSFSHCLPGAPGRPQITVVNKLEPFGQMSHVQTSSCFPLFCLFNRDPYYGFPTQVFFIAQVYSIVKQKPIFESSTQP